MLSATGRIIIEVGLNESVSAAEHESVPVTPAAVASDLEACARAGAAVAHFHARHPDGSTAWVDDGFYREATRVEAGCDILWYPTYDNRDLSFVWQLVDEPGRGLPVAFSPFDVVQEVGLSRWDPDAGSLVAASPVPPAGEDPSRPPNVAAILRSGLSPTVSVFDVGHARRAGLAAQCGILPQPLNLKVFLCDSWVLGPMPTPAAIDLYLAQIPEGVDVETTIVPYGMQNARVTDALLRAALDRGLHIRVGLGDNPAAFPGMTNADLVERAVRLLEEYGYAPATAENVRDRFAPSR